VLPGNPAQLNFDFNLTNLSANPSSFFVTNVQVTDSNDATVSTNSTPTPSVALASTGTYLTKAGSGTITIKTAGLQNNLINGEKVYLSNPGQSVDGISGASLTGFFTVSNVTSTSFDINISPTAFAGGTTDVSGVTATPPYAKSQPGQQTRTQSDGVVTADLSGNKTSPFYNVTATIAVDDGSGVPQSTQITYRINNQQSGLYGTQYSAVALSGSGTLVRPTSSAPLAVASLVDANGIELPKVNGQYVTNVQGFLKIAAGNTSNVVSIDSLDSIEQGQPNNNPAIPGTNANFSSYFALNNFFDSNKLTGTGDTVYGSAANLQVEKRIAVNPSLVSLGTLTRSPQPTDPLAPPNYTYESAVGDGSVVTKLAALGSAAVNFKAAGGLGNTQQSFNGYMTQVIGATSANASSAQSASTQAQTLMSGYQQQASSVSGVNLDTELANTVIYQNAYAASARVITVTNTLFDTLLQSFQ
jgi:flagellar hook-associated protein FlgK